MWTDPCSNASACACRSATKTNWPQRTQRTPSFFFVADSSSCSLWRRVDARMRSLDESGLLRTLRPPAGIDLSSNDYLGLARDPRIVSAMIAGLAREGVGSTGSRLLSGERESFTALEERFARFKGTERALYFSSGYLANLAVLTTFADADDVIVSDERNH